MTEQLGSLAYVVGVLAVVGEDVVGFFAYSLRSVRTWRLNAAKSANPSFADLGLRGLDARDSAAD
jgi:hypothetical protein